MLMMRVSTAYIPADVYDARLGGSIWLDHWPRAAYTEADAHDARVLMAR